MKAKKKKAAALKTKKKAAGKTKKQTKAKVKTKSKKKGLKTHIIAIIDKSGSMNDVKAAAIDGFNEFLNQQKKMKDKTTMNVVLFSSHDKITPLYNGEIIDLQNVVELNNETYVPLGGTALNDAIVHSMTNYKLKLNDMKPSKRPDKVLVIIVTDGKENASQEYPQNKIDEVKKIITKRKTENWQFMFLCSTEDTALAGEAFGFSKGNTFQFTNTNDGNGEMYSRMSSAAVSFRSLNVNSRTYSAQSDNLLAEDQVDIEKPINLNLPEDRDVV